MLRARRFGENGLYCLVAFTGHAEAASFAGGAEGPGQGGKIERVEELSVRIISGSGCYRGHGWDFVMGDMERCKGAFGGELRLGRVGGS